MLYADDLTFLTNEPRDMQIMPSRLAVYARNQHLIVNTSKSEVVHFNSAGEMFLFLMLAVPPFITKIILGIWYLGMVFYRTLNMAKSAIHAARPFLASACRIHRIVQKYALADRPHTSLWGSLKCMLFLLACMVVKYGVLVFAGRQGVLEPNVYASFAFSEGHVRCEAVYH